MTGIDHDPVLLSVKQDGVLTLTLNRPAARNALSLSLVRDLRAAFDAYQADPEARAAILTGSPPVFSTGLDLKDFAAPDSPRGEVGDLIRSVAAVTKPLIAAVNGPAMTGGLELALGCDFILASEEARFGDTHLKIGALSGSGMNSRLPQAVGLRWAKQMILGCQPVDAATALRIGLVNEVLPADRLMERAQDLARTIAGWNPELVAIVKNTLDRGSEGTLADALHLEADALAARKARSAMAWATQK